MGRWARRARETPLAATAKSRSLPDDVAPATAMAGAQAMRCASGADAKDAEHGQSCGSAVVAYY
jgi:hypothetical protein